MKIMEYDCKNIITKYQISPCNSKYLILFHTFFYSKHNTKYHVLVLDNYFILL